MKSVLLATPQYEPGLPSPCTGIPRTPDPPVGVSDTPGVVLLTLSTPESGTTPPQMFLFVVNVVLASSGTTISRTLEANDFMDAQARQFAIDGLMAGGVYLFSAQAQNEFGSSDFSGNSQRVQVATSRFQLCVWVCVCVCVCVNQHFTRNIAKWRSVVCTRNCGMYEEQPSL